MYLKSFSFVAIFLTIYACGHNSNTKQNAIAPGNSSKLPPVETKPPNSDYKPAFAGQTRIAGMATTTPLDVKVISEDLINPWGIAFLPDGRLLITQKAGTLRIATTEGKLSAPISGLPKVNDNGQGGLLGITVDPDFNNNRMVYWCFAENYNGSTMTSVGKGRLADDETKIENAAVIYRAQPLLKTNSTLHYGGRILFDKQGNLAVSTGERSNKDTRPEAQNPNSPLGKVLKITKNGKPAASNKNGLAEIYTLGHRNVQGIAFHPETGDLWECEFGPFGGDEVNRLEAGKNYGWAEITYGLEYSGEKINNGLTQKNGLEQPIYYWDPVVSPSGMTFYSGNQIPEWKNNLFIGCLSGNHIVRLKIENNKVVGEERLLESEGQRFRDVQQGKDGNLYAICDGQHGRLYKISKK